MLIGGGRSSRYPFTALQWQELEHQALIFKYMMSGLPVPPELIIPIRRSLFMDSTTLPFFPPSPPPPLKWGAHQMGYGRKAEDPEPGRCRRTDGKKWRCSKEAYPDSKYCERHMHRGKSRSRKLVELSLATNSTSAHEFPAGKDLLPLPPPPPPPLSLSFPCSSSSRFPPATGFPHPDNTANFSLPSVPHAVDTYRNFLGFKEDINELPFFSESTGAARGTCCSQPTGSFDYKQEGGGSHFRSDSLEKKDRHCFVLGSDLRSEREEREERQKLGPFHCFFDELPQRSRAPWTSSDENRVQHDSFSKTQLSISIPAASHELPVKASQCYSGPNLAA